MKGERNGMYGKTGTESPNFGKIRNNEHKQNYRLSKLGKKNPNFGKILTEEEKHNISEKMKGKNSKMITVFDSFESNVIKIETKIYWENKHRYFNMNSKCYKLWKQSIQEDAIL